jgi:D-alanine-D-alanine ligase
MKICVLQPDYSTTSVDYKYYDPPRDLTKLLPDDQVDHVFLNKLTTFKQLRDLKKKGYDIFVNLCEGYPDWEVPSVDVIHCMDTLNLPYTGPGAILYDVPKPLMKYIAYCAGVKTPHAVEITSTSEVKECISKLRFPMFVKPAHAGDSRGVDDDSLVHTAGALKKKVASIIDDYPELLVEEYIAGREFTVLVAANPDGRGCKVYQPVEYRFPEGREFKTYALKTSELHPECNFPCNDPAIEPQLRSAAEQIFTTFGGVGYGRMDFRMDENGDIYFLEINFTCSVLYEDEYRGSADYVLTFDPAGKSGFLKQIIAEGLARYESRQKKFKLKGSCLSGYGIFATRGIRKNEVIFKGEELSQRLVSKTFVEKNWTGRVKEDFHRYAYPVSNEIYVFWDQDPMNWAPQNHSCDANCKYQGLNVIATRNIPEGEELTLDYAMFLDETMEPFACQCGSPKCRKFVSGTKMRVAEDSEETVPIQRSYIPTTGRLNRRKSGN